MQLSDIQKSISEMDDNEIRELLSGLRSNRRVSKRPPVAAKKAKEVAVSGSEASAESLMNSLNAEQAAQLLALMNGGKK